jgi:hypothetical protein
VAVTIMAADFWVQEERTDPWGLTISEVLDTERLAGLISARDPQHSDLDVTLALMDLIRDDFQHSGTSGDGSGRIADGDMRLAVRALERTSDRAGLPRTGWRSAGCVACSVGM